MTGTIAHDSSWPGFSRICTPFYRRHRVDGQGCNVCIAQNGTLESYFPNRLNNSSLTVSLIFFSAASLTSGLILTL